MRPFTVLGDGMNDDVLNEYGQLERRVASFAQIASFMCALCTLCRSDSDPSIADKAGSYLCAIQSWLVQRNSAALVNTTPFAN